ncbi:hypothetical protein [Bythopirellula goksoeyrii]|uniref:Uncharacterized protein n=1 Tax=Bythopirellula goksoeyrii TaxID=1400387 RepID=A0A5B9QBJ8_9BACT|nr:hypothetical protein [Bythopirellula goksoeyrii]QEG34940.1 hypothetical protein Pr1d_22290 [Bythopirellula goksoeyrii]
MARICTVLTYLSFCLLFIDNVQGGEFDELLYKVPASANTLVLINVEQTLQAPIAQEEGWGKKLELAYVERPIFLPPEANKLVLAAALQPSQNFSQLWELGVMQLSEPMSLRSIARSEGGYLDTIDGTEAVWTPSDAYFVKLDDQELGVMFPAERQFVSRWLNFANKNNEVSLTEYLREATRLTNEKVQILMAIDLANVVQPHEVLQTIEASSSFKKIDLTPQEIVPILASLQGAILRVAVGKDVQGQLRIDFGSDISALKPIAKDLILSVLGDMGANISDLESWKFDVKEKAIHMQGPLSQDGQRRVFSVIELPSTKFSQLKDSTGESQTSEATPESQIREASITYFRAIDVLVKDLRRDLQGNKASAAVMERYSRKIDRMPILNVDPELLDFGGHLATTLRSMALAKRQGGIAYGTATAGMGGGGYSNYSIDYGYFGNLIGDAYSGARSSAADRSAARAQSMAAANSSRVEGFKLIDDATAVIRRKMTEKYQVEF